MLCAAMQLEGKSYLECSLGGFSTQSEWGRLGNCAVAFAVLAYLLVWLRLFVHTLLLIVSVLPFGLGSVLGALFFSKPMRIVTWVVWGAALFDAFIIVVTGGVVFHSYNDKYYKDSPDDIQKLKPDVCYGLLVLVFIIELAGGFVTYKASQAMKTLATALEEEKKESANNPASDAKQWMKVLAAGNLAGMDSIPYPPTSNAGSGPPDVSTGDAAGAGLYSPSPYVQPPHTAAASTSEASVKVTTSRHVEPCVQTA